MKVTFKSNSAAFDARLKEMLPRLAVVARKHLRESSTRWTVGMDKRFTGYYPGLNRSPGGAVRMTPSGVVAVSPRGRLRARSQALRGSVRSSVTGRNMKSLRARFFVGGGKAGYAALQEFGGVIKPVSARALTIPLENAYTAGGRFRNKAKIRKEGDSYTTDFGPTFIRNKVIFADLGNDKVLPLYVLRQRVEVPARLGAGYTLNEVAKRTLPKMLTAMSRVLGGKR